MIVLARLGLDGHTRPHGVVFCAICLAPINASGLLGRQPAKSGSSFSQRPQEGSSCLKASFLAFSSSKALSIAR